MVVVTDICIRKRKWREGVDAGNLKPSHYSLVLGLLCQTTMVGGVGWWWWWCVEVVAVMGIMFANASGEAGLGQKTQNRVQFQAAPAHLVLKGVAVWIQQPLLE